MIFDHSCASEVYWSGYYGTFLGVHKPRSRDVKSPLELSIVEALYLAERNRIIVKDGTRELTPSELFEIGRSRIRKFEHLYRAYVDLRNRGFIVRRGLKFGCDYLVYRQGPGIDHAPFGVLVYTEDEVLDPIELVRAGRLLHSVRKKLVITIVSSNGDVKYIVLDWWKP